MKNWKTKTVDGVKGIVLPKIDRELHELPSTAMGAKVRLDNDGNPIEVVDEASFVPFADPGKRVASKRLYTIKVIKGDGTLIQVPFENQVNNNIASPENAIGLRGFQRKGFQVLFDFETHTAAFCPTWGCWAEWNDKLDGFCSESHREITKPKDDDSSRFGTNATTSSEW